MYNKSRDTSKVVFLCMYSNYLAQLSRVLEENQECKARNLAIKNFLQKLKTKGIKAKELGEVVESCNQYINGQMNDVCLALVVVEEQNKVQNQLNEIKDEKICLAKILKEADQITITKCFNDDKKTALKQLVDGKKIDYLTEEFNEIVKIVEMAVTEEINPVEANRQFENILSHLRFLGEYLK